MSAARLGDNEKGHVLIGWYLIFNVARGVSGQSRPAGRVCAGNADLTA